MKRINWLIILTAGILFLSGCALFGSGDSDQMTKSVDTLLAEGTAAFRDGKYKKAVRAFSDLKDWYPFSKYAILAELKLADAHYELEEYDEALFAYETFEQMHPKNEAIPYVIYMSGLCWFDRIKSVDRDSTPARKSLDLFTRLMEQYPESDYASKAEEKIEACRDNLAGHELYVADYYLKTKNYKAALKRYEYLVENYPESSQAKKAMEQIPRCWEFIEKNKN